MACPSVSCRTLCLSIGCLVAVVLLEILWVLSLDDLTKFIKIFRVQLHIMVELIALLSVWYIWRRVTFLVRTNSIASCGFIFKLIIMGVLIMSLVTMVLIISPIETDPHVLSFVSSFSLGVVIFLTSCLGISDVLSFLYRLPSRFRHSFSGRPPPPSVDKTEAKIRILLALLAALVLVCYGTMAASTVIVERVQIPVRGLHTKLNGTTVVQVSDIHLGPFNGKWHLEEIVTKVNEVHPDIVVITGDLADASFERLKETASLLKNIKSKHGVYYITGNHEYYTGDVDGWISGLPLLNVTPLVNERVCLLGSHVLRSSSCDDGLYLAGLEDIETRKMRYGSHSMDLHSALSGRTKGTPTIVLAHQPWAAAEAIMWDDVRLVLSGHTHAGQVLPFFLHVYLYNPFFVGLYEPQPDVFVYVNPGSLYYMIPFRHVYKPEVTHFTLISK